MVDTAILLPSPLIPPTLDRRPCHPHWSSWPTALFAMSWVSSTTFYEGNGSVPYLCILQIQTCGLSTSDSLVSLVTFDYHCSDPHFVSVAPNFIFIPLPFHRSLDPCFWVRFYSYSCMTHVLCFPSSLWFSLSCNALQTPGSHAHAAISNIMYFSLKACTRW